MAGVEVLPIHGRVDVRGIALVLPQDAVDFLGRIAEVHYVTLEPGAVRGNHRHMGRREVLLVHASGPWRLGWQGAADPAPVWRDFDDLPAALVLIPDGVWHAIKNAGTGRVSVVSCSSAEPVPGDTAWREL